MLGEQPVERWHEIALPEGLFEFGEERPDEVEIEGPLARTDDARCVLQVLGPACEDLCDEEVFGREDGNLDASDIHLPCAVRELLFEA